MDLPACIDKNLFESSLRKYLKDNGTKMLDFSCKPAISVGENYTTYVFRVNITYVRSNSSRVSNKENLSLIVKCMREGLMEGLAEEMNMFRKELDMLAKILPKMNELYGSNVLSGNCLNGSLEPIPYLLVQDICPLGFKVHERQCGLDMDHSLKVLEKLASFHASSYIICEKNPSILSEMYSQGIYPRIPAIVAWVTVGLEMMADLTVNCKEFNIYEKKMKSILESDFMQRCLDSWHPKKDEFTVINHGDLWVNNVMFSYDDKGKVKDCRYIDFQFSMYSSPAIDLHYFISTSLANDVVQEVDRLLDYYYVCLLMSLNKLKCSLKNVPSLKEFKEDYRRRSFYGIVAMATVMGLVRCDSRKDASIDAIVSSSPGNDFRHHCYNNDAYKSSLIRLLPVYEKLGVFS